MVAQRISSEGISSPPASIVSVPAALVRSRAARVRMVLDTFEAPPDDGLTGVGFTGVIDDLLERVWSRAVVGPAMRVAPGLLEQRFFSTKLKAGFSVYCALGLSAVACSTTRPGWLRAGAGLARTLGLGTSAIAALARPLMPLLYRTFCAREMERAAAASAFILVMDEILDDELGHLGGDARVAAVAGIASGERPLDSEAGRFVGALVETLRAVDPAGWLKIAARVAEWARAEVQLDVGAALEPRKLTIDVSMEVLGFALPAHVHPRELAWMQGIATLGQMVDDVVDLEKDLGCRRFTLAAAGTWTNETVDALYQRVVASTAELLDAGGELHPATRGVYLTTLRAQLRHMAEVLAANP